MIGRSDEAAGTKPVKLGQHPAGVTLPISCVFRNDSEIPHTQSGSESMVNVGMRLQISTQAWSGMAD